MTQRKDDLSSKVEEWVNKQGYPFEMRVAAAFRKAGFGITQSDYYTDTETGTAREIDVVASMQRWLDPVSGELLRGPIFTAHRVARV